MYKINWIKTQDRFWSITTKIAYWVSKLVIFLATERLLVRISDTTCFELGRWTRVYPKMLCENSGFESQTFQKCTHPWIVCPTVIWFQCLLQIKTLKSFSLYYYYSTKHFLIPEGNHYQPLYVKYSNRSFREQTTLVCEPLVQTRLKGSQSYTAAGKLFWCGMNVYLQNWLAPSSNILHCFHFTRGSTLTSQDYRPSSVVYVPEPIRAI